MMDFYSNLKAVLIGEKGRLGLAGVCLYVVRSDGSVIYKDGDFKNNQAVGALISGAWQATTEILKHDKDASFRFSFDTSSSGIYVLSLVLEGETLYLASIFKNEVNPGRLKVNMRKMRNVLSEKLDGLSPAEPPREGLLFEDLSDDEVNNLFSFGD